MAGYASVQAEVVVLLRHYISALAMPGHAAAYAEAIAPAAWDAFRPGTKLHKPEIFAEILAFHALKAAGLPIDQVTFRKASLVGSMPMCSRHWLLHYAVYLPPALRVACREPSPEAWLSLMPPGPVIDTARDIMATSPLALATMRPGIRAGAAVVTAWKRSGTTLSGDANLGTILRAAGISMASAYNAATRVGLIAPRARFEARDASQATVA